MLAHENGSIYLWQKSYNL